MRVFVTMEYVFTVDVDTTDPKKAELAAENNWDTIYRHRANPHKEGRFLFAMAVPTPLEQNRAICGYCQVLQQTNPGEWCDAHRD